MQNDRLITIAVGASRKATLWQNQQLTLSAFYDRLKTPGRGTEAQADYLNMPKAQQDALKDVGGFVAGALSAPRRKAANVANRDVITLDLDNIQSNGTDDALKRIEGLGCGYCVYSTRKHRPSAPRLRVLLPLDRPVTPDEYEPIARRVAATIGMELADPTTFEPSRLMYWATCSADAEYIYRVADKPFLAADGVLSTYTDWRNHALWPSHAGAVAPQRLAAKQGDPESKTGVVGAFCRVYDVATAMDTFLPGVYAEAEHDRYTFVGGSTAGGAVLYDNGKFLFSHHATDPCSGRLVNAFDLVRLHKFDQMDDEAAPDTPVDRLPSFVAMTELAAADKQVAALRLTERLQETQEAFTAQQQAPDLTWTHQLENHSKTGLPLPTIRNVRLILEHDHNLSGKFVLNEFANRVEVIAPLPWDARAELRAWEDSDNSGIYDYIEQCYKISNQGKVDHALAIHGLHHRVNRVADYLNGLAWDGVPRLETLFVRYLGAEDGDYTRAVTRKAFAGAVARALDPGSKFDHMTILVGAQGLYKSTLLDKMSRGWFNDSIRTFEGKEASELLQGVWLVEIAELEAFRRSEVSRIKQFLTLRYDRFRAAYGRNVQELPRRCVFFGTTNAADFLQDRTGNRRFWPVRVGCSTPSHGVWQTLDGEVDQLWAEAVALYRAGEPLYLSGELEAMAVEAQEAHRETSAREGLVVEFVSRPVPEDWQKWSIERRKMYWAGGLVDTVPTVPRQRVCALEIWVELFGGNTRDLKPADSRELLDIVASIPGWRRTAQAFRAGEYGVQRGAETV